MASVPERRLTAPDVPLSRRTILTSLTSRQSHASMNYNARSRSGGARGRTYPRGTAAGPSPVRNGLRPFHATPVLRCSRQYGIGTCSGARGHPRWPRSWHACRPAGGTTRATCLRWTTASGWMPALAQERVQAPMELHLRLRHEQWLWAEDPWALGLRRPIELGQQYGHQQEEPLRCIVNGRKTAIYLGIPSSGPIGSASLGHMPDGCSSTRPRQTRTPTGRCAKALADQPPAPCVASLADTENPVRKPELGPGHPDRQGPAHAGAMMPAVPAGMTQRPHAKLLCSRACASGSLPSGRLLLVSIQAAARPRRRAA